MPSRAGGASDYSQLPDDLPVPVDDGAAAHLRGSRLPALELPATDGRHLTLNALGAGRSVLYVYPMTGRPGVALPEGWDAIPGARGCTPESCGFRDHHDELHRAGAARVFGLSSQDTDYQREAAQRLQLPFPLLSDAGLALAAEPGLPTFAVDGVRLFARITLLVRDDIIEHVWYPVFPPDRHAGQVLAWLRTDPP
ncbi:MAG: peroxiredoxin [Jatrophihabitantaceae bacterium]